MGSIVGGLFGGGGSGGSAAGIQNVFLDRAIDEMRRQFDASQENLDPFISAGTGLLPDLVASTTPQGLNANLGRIFDTNLFNNLVDERTRAVQGQLGATGLSRSGTGLQEIAAVPTGVGLNIEQLLNARQAGLAGSAQNAAIGLGSLGAQTSSGIADLLARQGENLGSGILTDAQADARGAQNLFGLGSTAASIFLPNLLSSVFPSDPALKENVEEIRKIGDLQMVQWDWIEGAKGTIIEKCMTIGFMADEVEEKYPHHVGEFGGFKVINYPALLDELEAKYGHA